MVEKTVKDHSERLVILETCDLNDQLGNLNDLNDRNDLNDDLTDLTRNNKNVDSVLQKSALLNVQRADLP